MHLSYGQRFGIGYIVEILRGANNQRIRDNGHDKLPVYGIGKAHSHEILDECDPPIDPFRYGCAKYRSSFCIQLTEIARYCVVAVSLPQAVPTIKPNKSRYQQTKIVIDSTIEIICETTQIT